MRNEIGSNYWLTEKEYQSALLSQPKVDLPYKLKNMVLTNLCRTGIELLLNELDINNGIALVPEFTCHSVAAPFAHHGYMVRGYKLQSNLSIDIEYLKEIVKDTNPDIIIMHSYFGFNTIPENIRDIIPETTIIIEDLTQRFLSSFPLIKANCYVGSIRKWMPIPDGGFYGGNIIISTPNIEDEIFPKLELNALLSKGKYMCGEKLEKKSFRDAFADAKKLLTKQNQFYTMSKISRQIFSTIDLECWKSVIQNNGRFLLEHLKEFEFLNLPFYEIDETTVPFLIPVFVQENRKEFQLFLANNDIYATIIWTCPQILQDKLSNVGKYIYNHILCFHCDYRYNLEDMNRIYDVVKNYYNLYYEQTIDGIRHK